MTISSHVCALVANGPHELLQSVEVLLDWFNKNQEGLSEKKVLLDKCKCVVAASLLSDNTHKCPSCNTKYKKAHPLELDTTLFNKVTDIKKAWGTSMSKLPKPAQTLADEAWQKTMQARKEERTEALESLKKSLVDKVNAAAKNGKSSTTIGYFYSVYADSRLHHCSEWFRFEKDIKLFCEELQQDAQGISIDYTPIKSGGVITGAHIFSNWGRLS